MTGTLRWYFGPMDCGKSTLALQVNHSQEQQGRRCLLLVRHDRSGNPMVSSRLGISRQAIEIPATADIRVLIVASGEVIGRLDYLVVDEAQFLAPHQVDQLATLSDVWGIDVYCFGIATDFQSHLFPGSRRLFELADELHPVQVPVLCWCGQPGRFNSRITNGAIVRDGDQVLVGDTDTVDGVHYRVLCRTHYRSGELGTARGVAA